MGAMNRSEAQGGVQYFGSIVQSCGHAPENGYIGTNVRAR